MTSRMDGQVIAARCRTLSAPIGCAVDEVGAHGSGRSLAGWSRVGTDDVSPDSTTSRVLVVAARRRVG